MKYIDLFEIVTKVGPFVRSEDSQGKTNQGPNMDGVVFRPEMMADIMNLGMAVMAAGDAVIGAGFNNLVELFLAVGPSGFSKARLEETTTTTAAVVIGAVRGHFNDVFGPDDRPHDIAQVLGDLLAIAFADDLAGILDGKFDLQVLVPIGTDLETTFANPLGVILVDGSNFKIVFDTEFFQSSPD